MRTPTQHRRAGVGTIGSVFGALLLSACPATTSDPEPEVSPAVEPEEAPLGCTEPTAVSCVDELKAAVTLQTGNLNPGTITETFDGSAVISTVNAKSGGLAADPKQSFVYARFTDDGLQKLNLDDNGALDSMAWDIAFHRYIVRLNGGSNGPSCVSAAKVDGTFQSVDENASGSFRLDTQFDDGCAFRADSEAGDPVNERDFGNVMRDYYTYNGCLAMSDQVFLVRLASGRVLKWKMDRYYDAASQAACDDGGGIAGTGAGELIMTWAFVDGFVGGDGDGDGDGDGWIYEGDAVTHMDEGDGVTWTRVYAPNFMTPVYVDVETKAEMFPADPANSDAYDLGFRNFRVHTNGGASGTGSAAIAVLDGQDFDTLTAAPVGPYHQDLADVNMDGLNEDVMSDQYPWYTYDNSTHLLTPNDIVYVIRSNDGAYYKLEMLSYYFEGIEERNHFMTFRSAEVGPPGGPSDGGVTDDAGPPGPDGGPGDAGM